jgi:hypothetical protein
MIQVAKADPWCSSVCMLYFYPQYTSKKYVKKEPQNRSQYSEECYKGKRCIPLLYFSQVGFDHPLFSLFRILPVKDGKGESRTKEKDENKGREKKEHEMLEISQFKKVQVGSSRENA